MANQRRSLDIRAHHHARAIHQRENWDVKRVAQLDESGALIRPVRINGPGQVVGIVRYDSHGLPFHPYERGNDTDPKLFTDF